MKKIIILSFLLISINLFAAKGIVVYKSSSCDWFIVNTNSGFIVMESYSGYFDEGDYVIGDIESYGFKNLFNKTRGIEGRVYVEDFQMSKDDAIEEFYKNCN